jgi:hypothetical protein
MKVCQVCLADANQKELKYCSKCKFVQYCCGEHQREHWSIHKPFCAQMVTRSAENQYVLEIHPPGLVLTFQQEES